MRANTIPNQTLNLNAGWTISNKEFNVPLPVPGDVHSALLKAEVISDPYWRDRETSLDWVHESDWLATKVFDVEEPQTGQWTLTFDCIDTVAEISLNGVFLQKVNSQYLRHDIDVTHALKRGQNTLCVKFLSNSAEAKRLAEDSAFPVPHIAWNNRIPHYNFLRKAHCHAGWDWNIALSPLGFYGDIVLRQTDECRLEDVMVRQTHQGGAVTLDVDLHFTGHMIGETLAQISCEDQAAQETVTVYPGTHKTTLSVTLSSPELWWPVGLGEQRLYELTVRLGGETRKLRIGLRDVQLRTEDDEIGQSFSFVVNGKDVFMRGANWIPADALPGRATPEVVKDLLQSVLDANMNMIRIWGGGQYEADWFYDLCSEMGIMVWHDFMFSCSLYPAQDHDWLNLVRAEANQQIRRLSSFPCMALWCGDNEVIGALTWFDESKKDRDRYLAVYARLNLALEEAIVHNAPDIAFWPSSPSVGQLNFGDGWHDDRSGDMHFWDVWHSAKDFEHYRTVQPRFCSEFGFQSFTSNPVIETFSEPKDRNVSSQVMEVHQRNPGGNSRIVETIQRYFRFPEKFEDMTFLSQISHSLAMKTSIEFWRASKPRCMGTLYWQLNDTWPVASWSSLDYGGGWKLTHYHARRFYDPVLITAQPDPVTDEIIILAVNDTLQPVTLHVSAQGVDVAGPLRDMGQWECACPTDRSIEIARIKTADFADQEFLHVTWRDESGTHVGENEYLPKRPKYYDLKTPQISVEVQGDNVTLHSDVPAFFVTYDHGGSDIWSDNGFTLLPGVPKTLHRQRKRSGPIGEAKIRYLS